MDRYLIEAPHTEKNCLDLIDQVNAAGFLTHFNWGCLNGVHCGWAIIEADDDAQARLAVPPLVRSQARVIKVVTFNHEMLRAMHRP